jgi:hypothetical protein
MIKSTTATTANEACAYVDRIRPGLALLEIRDQRLYREAGYRTFEEYCKERWGWSICHVNRPSPWRPMLASSSPTHAWQPTRPLAYVVASSTTWYCRPDVGW